jgi:hypothetical protein
MKVFSIVTGKSRIEFSMYFVNGKYQARINDRVFFENTDYHLVREFLTEGMEYNLIRPIGETVH